MINETNNEVFDYSQKRNNLLDNLNKIKGYAQELELPKVMEIIESNLKIASGFKVAVVGEFNRGKSTLINALLGEKVLPADILPCTATVNRISFGLVPSVKIVFKEKDGQPSRIESVDFNKLSEYVTQLTEHSKIMAADIEEALIEYNINYLRDNIDIIDTPGLNDSAEMTLITLDLLDKAHAAIMVISADSPVAATEKAFLEKLADKNIGRVLFVITRMDIIEEEDRERLLFTIKQRISSAIEKTAEKMYGEGTKEYENYIKTFGEPKLFVVSPNKGLKGKISNNQLMIEESGLRSFEDSLKIFLTRDVGKVIIRSLAQLIINNTSKVLYQIQIKESAGKASVEDFELVYEASIQELEELKQKYKIQISRVKDAAEITKNNAVRILNDVENRLINGSVETINSEVINVSDINQKHIEVTQSKLGQKIEENLSHILESVMSEIELLIGRELQDASERLQLFGEEVVHSINRIQEDFIKISTKVNSDETTNADIAKGAALSVFAIGIPIISGFYTGYKEGGWKGLLLGGSTGTVAGIGTAAGLGILVGALGLAVTAPVLIPIVIASSIVAAITGKHATRRFLSGDKVELFRENYRKESSKLIQTEINKLKPMLLSKVTEAVLQNFQKLEDLVDNELGKLITQTEETVHNEASKKTRSEAEVNIELNKMAHIKQVVLASRNHAETTLEELQGIESV